MSRPHAIVVLGEALVDVFAERDLLGGASFNVARNLVALGAAPLFVSRVGRDARGAQIASEFERLAMDARGLQYDASRATGTAVVHMHDGQPRFEIAADAAWDQLDADLLVEAVRAARPQLIYFGTLAQRGAGSRAAIRAGLAATQARRVLDLNLRAGADDRALAAESLELTEIAKVNGDELDRLLRWFVDPSLPAGCLAEPSRRGAVHALIARFDLQRLIVTRGALGWASFDAQEGFLEGASPMVAVRDTVGAGDAFCALLLLGEANRWPLAVTLERASRFASAVCTIQGAFDAGSPIYAAARAT